MKHIKFTNKLNIDLYPPKPASDCIPDWYKNTMSYVNGTKTVIDATGTSTIKKCMPVFDAMTSGYILFTPCDLWVSFDIEGSPFYQWSAGPTKIEIHSRGQASEYPTEKHGDIPFPKWINDWIIETPPGYSTLFIPPMHNPNDFFTVLPGIVDTDTYKSCVHFPFTLKKTDKNFLVPAGTPMVQVIPFKRDSWKMQFGDSKDIDNSFKIDRKIFSVFYNRYKNAFWHRKEYK